MRFVCIVYLRVVCFCTSVVTSFQFFVYHCGGNYLYAHNLFFFLIPFMKELFDFKLLSLNVREIRSATKRKALFTWLNERRYDIIFLQEEALLTLKTFGEHNGEVSSFLLMALIIVVG